MERCPRCSEAIESAWAYCPACGRSRILESLRAPVKTPDWQYKVLRSLIAVLAVWLAVTIGVAFLREAKAVRDARKLLESGKAQEAWSTLEPFLAEHPEHQAGCRTALVDGREELVFTNVTCLAFIDWVRRFRDFVSARVVCDPNEWN